ncbi:MAG TPA: PE-PPE domain-containing protein [Pseudonocardiaceae bacterium]|nr:PE-PPE domain-containing protein [Pseudonocardiaceae bacterium]
MIRPAVTAWVATVALGAALTAAIGPAATAATAAGCPSTMIFEVGGHLDPDAHVYDQSNAALPPGVAFTQVHYPAQIAPYPGDTISLDDSVAEGVANLDHDAQVFTATCADSHLTIAGYSEGALVAGNELGDLAQDTTIPADRLNGVLYSDGRREGVDGGAGGIETNLPTIIPGLTMQGPRGFGDLAVQELCNQNDGICNSENPFTNLLAFANGVDGYFSGAHGQYDFNPIAHSGSGNSVTPQPPLIPYGPPLPVAVPTPYQLFNGNLDGARNAVAQLRGQVADAVGPRIAAELDKFPWLSA